MAIIKELNTKFGIGASYHRITAFNISYSSKKITICVASYLSKEARVNKNDPIEELDISIPFEDFTSFLNFWNTSLRNPEALFERTEVSF